MSVLPNSVATIESTESVLHFVSIHVHCMFWRFINWTSIVLHNVSLSTYLVHRKMVAVSEAKQSNVVSNDDIIDQPWQRWKERDKRVKGEGCTPEDTYCREVPSHSVGHVMSLW